MEKEESKHWTKDIKSKPTETFKSVATGAVAGFAAGIIANQVMASNGISQETVPNAGIVDAIIIDSFKDGTPDLIGIDQNGDGIIDALILDQNNDGIVDAIITDSNFDGIADALIVDSNFDGVADAIIVDSNFDGIADALIVDSNFNGITETINIEDNDFNNFSTNFESGSEDSDFDWSNLFNF